jgi:phage-related protein
MKDFFGENHNLDEKSMESLITALERENLPGFDYLEFKQALARLGSLNMEESLIFKSAFATASTIGVTKDKLLKTAGHYKNVLAKEKKSFDAAMNKQVKAKVEGKRKEVEALKKKLALYEAKINELEQLKVKATKTINTADETIKNAQDGIDKVKTRFETTLKALLNQIDKDIEDIGKYLS